MNGCSSRWFWLGIVLVLAFGVLPAAAQDDPIIVFTPYEGNPVFDRAAGEAWGGECGTIFAPQVIFDAGVYYLFYSGSCERSGRPAAIGFATSTDGVDWSTHADNPVLAPDGEGYDAMCISIGVPVVEAGQWYLYYAANSTPCAGPGQHIGRAVAASPAGPWERTAEPLVEAGAAGDWDAGFIMPHAVIHTETGYIMYYSGGQEFLTPLPRLFGIATSTDGEHWTKYDDPATTEPPFDHSDPIMELQADGTAIPLEVWSADIAHTDDGWEMIFSVTSSESTSPTSPTLLGYGTSVDGLHWQLYREPAVMTRGQVNQAWASSCICYPTFVRHDDLYQVYFTGCTAELNDCRIGLAQGTITQPAP